MRHAPLYATVAAPLIASELSGWWKSGAARSQEVLDRAHSAPVGEDLAPEFPPDQRVAGGVHCGVGRYLDAPIKWPTRLSRAKLFPTAMVHENAELLATGRLLTTDQWGDYIIYCFYPRQKVFVDGRSDFYGETLGNEYLHLLQGAYDWRAILEQIRLRCGPVAGELAAGSILKLDPSWQVVKDDSKAILFQRLSRQSPGN